jgi:hypothetical protein
MKRKDMKRVNIKETDNRDSSKTDLILDNGTVVSIDVQDLFENMLENLGDDDLLDKFYELQKLIEDRD